VGFNALERLSQATSAPGATPAWFRLIHSASTRLTIGSPMPIGVASACDTPHWGQRTSQRPSLRSKRVGMCVCRRLGSDTGVEAR
jgi:hypothetical protein